VCGRLITCRFYRCFDVSTSVTGLCGGRDLKGKLCAQTEADAISNAKSLAQSFSALNADAMSSTATALCGLVSGTVKSDLASQSKSYCDFYAAQTEASSFLCDASWCSGTTSPNKPASSAKMCCNVCDKIYTGLCDNANSGKVDEQCVNGNQCDDMTCVGDTYSCYPAANSVKMGACDGSALNGLVCATSAANAISLLNNSANAIGQRTAEAENAVTKSQCERAGGTMRLGVGLNSYCATRAQAATTCDPSWCNGQRPPKAPVSNRCCSDCMTWFTTHCDGTKDLANTVCRDGVDCGGSCIKAKSNTAPGRSAEVLLVLAGLLGTVGALA